MNEKEAIEKATADAFIELYNSEMGTSFSIVEYSDAPDIRCKEPTGDILNFEITLTEDRQRDIQAALGRSDHKSIEALKVHLTDVRAGKANPLERASCLQGNVSDMVVGRILPKLQKDYGSNVALVVRDSSAVCWDWDLVVDQIKGMLDLQRNPFDKGIWIISFRKDKIFRVV
ncbi:MAG TPA: hypothetical protein PKO34_07285 [Smithellaceae bacterium]|nr:hypothetical protein [Syntrophus sp. (in: bacteria)]HNS56839.1 hypothetical protein [Smithellaceae bacterium]